MAKTLTGIIQLILKDGASASAKKVEQSLNGVRRAATGLGAAASGADRLTASLNRMGSAPWGASLQSRLEKLKLLPHEFDKVRASWDKLQASLSGGANPKLDTRMIANWRAGVIAHFSAVQASANATRAKLADVLKVGFTAAGLGTGAYVNGRLVSGTLRAGSEFERARSRSYFAGLPEGDRTRLSDAARKYGPKYGLSSADALESITDAALGFGSVEKAVKTADAFAAAQAYLTNMFGSEQAGTQLRQMATALDTLEINDPDRVRSVIDGLMKAQMVEGKDFSPEQWALAIRYGRTASRFFSDEFLTKRLPALVSESGGSDVGTMLQSLYQGFGSGKAPVSVIAEQAKLGLREGYQPTVRGNKKLGIVAQKLNKGRLVGYEDFIKDPISWVYKYALPALQANGVDLENDEQLAEALGKITGQRTQGDILTRAIRSQQQYERKMKEQYPQAKGLDDATKVAEMDPFAAYQKFLNGLKNIASALGVMETIAGGLSKIGDGLNFIAGGITAASNALKEAGPVGQALATLGAVFVGGGLAYATISAAAGALGLIGSAVGAIAGTAGGGGAVAAAAGLGRIAGALTAINAIFSTGAGLAALLAVGGGAVLAASGLIDSKNANPDAIRLEEEAAKRREQRRLADEELVNRYRTPANPGSRFFAQDDATGVDAAVERARQAGARIQSSLNVTASPQVDQSSLAATESTLDRIIAKLGQIRAQSQGLSAGVGSAYSDFGVSP